MVRTWAARFLSRMLGLLLLMLLVEFAAFVLYREAGINRLLWLPISFGLVALGGYDTVKRMPLVWGALVGALLAGTANLLSWMIGALVMQGTLGLPDEAQPLLVASSLLIAAIVGGIVGVCAGMVARGRRRHRARRSAMKELAYTAFDEPGVEADELPPPPMSQMPLSRPLAERAGQRR